MSIRLVVDSASDISASEAIKLGIIMVPMVISFEDKDYLDGVNITPYEFYEKLVKAKTLPHTSQINPYRFEEIYEEYKDDELIIITISSKLSGTYNSAVQASIAHQERVSVIDSLNACIGERLLILLALDLIKKGKPRDEIVSSLEEAKKKIHVYALLGTLEYLKKGGRISKTVAFGGELLDLKPVVGIVDGEVKLCGKALGTKRGFGVLNRLTKDVEIDTTLPNGLLYSGSEEEMINKFKVDKLNPLGEESKPYVLGGTIGTHVGPGAVGIAFFRK